MESSTLCFRLSLTGQPQLWLDIVYGWTGDLLLLLFNVIALCLLLLLSCHVVICFVVVLLCLLCYCYVLLLFMLLLFSCHMVYVRGESRLSKP